MTTFSDEVRETVSPHKFGGSRMAAACYLLSLESGEDEATGDASEWHYYAARFGRRILYTDSFGFVWVDTYSNELQAVRAFEADERSYGEFIEAQEAEHDAYSDGFRPADTITLDELEPGATVRVEGCDGIAFRVDGLPVRHLPDYDWTGIEWQHPGRRLVHMVGDDRTFDYPCDILTPLDDDEYCASCGQIGCEWC